MPGFIFNSTLRPYQAPVDLGTLERTYNKLEEGHQQTIGLATAYKTQLASLDLNAEEDAWRQQKIAQIDNAIANNITYGNAYTAMDDVMKEIGDIASDPGMIGRIRAQKQYTDWLTELDNSNLSQDYKNYFKEKNKYYYEDKYDNNGKVIGGTDWLPQENWVDQINYAAVMQQAIQLAAEEQGGGTSHYFIDANGNRTNDMSKAASAMYIDSVTGQWTKLTEDKIKLAFDGLINANPEYRAAVDQDYRIAKDYYEKEGIDKYGIINRDGYEMTRQEFLDNKIDPVAAAASYYRSKSNSTLKEGIGASLAASKMSGLGASLYGGASNFDPTVYTTNKVTYNNDAPVIFTAQRNQAINGFKSLFPNYDFSNFDYDSADKLINESNLDDKEKFAAQQYINMYIESENYLDKLKQDLTPEEQSKMDTKLAIESGGSVDNSTPEGRQWTSLVDTAFKQGNGRVFREYDIDDINKFLEDYPGGEVALNNQGVYIERNGDKAKIALNETNKNNFYQYMKITEQANRYRTGLDAIEGFFNDRAYYSAMRNVYNKLNRSYDNSMKSAGKVTSSLEFTLGPNAKGAYYRELFHSTGESKYKSLADYEDNAAKEALRSSGLSQYDIWGYNGDTGIFEKSLGDEKDSFGKLNSEDRYNLQHLINSGYYDMDKAVFSYGNFKGEAITQVVIPGKAGTKTTEGVKPLKFYIRNFGSNRFDANYINQPETRAINTITDYTNAGIDIPITNINPLFNGLRRFSITPTGDHNNYILNNLTANPPERDEISKLDAQSLKAAIYRIEECIHVLKTLKNMPDITKNEFNDALDDYCAITGSIKENVAATILDNATKLLTQ